MARVALVIPQFVVINHLERLVQRCLIVAAVVKKARGGLERIVIKRSREVLPANLNWVHAQLAATRSSARSIT